MSELWYWLVALMLTAWAVLDGFDFGAGILHRFVANTDEFRRLVRDIRLLKRRYDIFITDGYSKDPVHSANGEHPMGLALDIVPRGRRWGKIDRLARWAEPTQNAPRAPFRC